jgi:hypothetical protein
MTDEKKSGGFLKGCLIAAAIVVVLGVVAFGGCLLLFGKAAKDISENVTQARKAEVERVKAEPISDVTWEEIDKIYNLKSKYTELQKKERWKNYKGKKVKWRGEVSSVDETFGTMSLQVKLNPGTFTSDVLVRLKPTEREKALKVSKQDMVTFVGILDDWGTIMPVTLDKGEMVAN